MKPLKTLSQLGGVASIGVGSVLLIKGIQGRGIMWAAISGAVIICSGIINIVAAPLGIIDAIGSLVLKLLELPEKIIREIIKE